MLAKPNWDRSLERWRAFWAGDVADRPPVIAHIVESEELDTGEPPSLEGTIAFYDPALNLPIIEAREKSVLQAAALLEDDTPPAIASGGGVYFTGAAFGAPVRVTANVMTSDPIIDSWEQADAIRYDHDNAWIRRALGLARQLVDRSAGRYAVTPGLLEGPSDICAELRGATRLAGDLYEYPDQVRRLAGRATDAWIAYASDLHAIIPLYDGGTVTQWSVWTPGRGIALQEDFCTLVSPSLFRDFVAPLDREIAATADTAWIHLHAGQVHLVDPFLEIAAIRGIQIVNDGVASPPMCRMLPAMQRVQAAGRPLILRKYTIPELESILPHLAPEGLALDVYLTSVTDGQSWLERLSRWPFR